MLEWIAGHSLMAVVGASAASWLIGFFFGFKVGQSSTVQ